MRKHSFFEYYNNIRRNNYMGIIEEIFRQFKHGEGEWKQFIKSIKITNIHGWQGQKINFSYPVVALVGENGIGKSTFLKAAACAYKNKCNYTFYPSQMFMRTQWDESALDGATIEYEVLCGNQIRSLKWKKTKDWGFSPRAQKPARNVYFMDISRTVPLDATAGYAKIAKSNSEVGEGKELTEASLNALSYVLGYNYSKARFTGTDANINKEVGLLTRDCGEISQFHQGAGEDSMLDMFKILQDIPQYSLLIIDEVENSLHPQAQRRFIKYLLEVARSKKIQVILSTHSPFVLEELPPIARIMLVKLSDTKDILYNISSNFALTSIDDTCHPDIYVFLEDTEAEALFWEIMKRNTDRYPIYLKKINTKAVGSCDVVNTLNNLCKSNKLPYKGFGIIDGDKRQEYINCISLPGVLAPEKMVFLDLKKLGWNNLDNRFGIGAGTLFSYLDDTILLPDHHDWTSHLGDLIKKSKNFIWATIIDEWCSQCLSIEETEAFIHSIDNKLKETEKYIKDEYES